MQSIRISFNFLIFLITFSKILSSNNDQIFKLPKPKRHFAMIFYIETEDSLPKACSATLIKHSNKCHLISNAHCFKSIKENIRIKPTRYKFINEEYKIYSY